MIHDHDPRPRRHEYARQHGHRARRLRSDSQSRIRQMLGESRVKSAGLQPLYQQAQRLAQLDRVVFEHVPRELNTEADRLANEAMDEAAARPTSAVGRDTITSNAG